MSVTIADMPVSYVLSRLKFFEDQMNRAMVISEENRKLRMAAEKELLLERCRRLLAEQEISPDLPRAVLQQQLDQIRNELLPRSSPWGGNVERMAHDVLACDLVAETAADKANVRALSDRLLNTKAALERVEDVAEAAQRLREMEEEMEDVA